MLAARSAIAIHLPKRLTPSIAGTADIEPAPKPKYFQPLGNTNTTFIRSAQPFGPNSPESAIGLSVMQEEYLNQSIKLARLIEDNFKEEMKTLKYI